MTDPNCSTLKDTVMLRPTSSCADADLLGYFSIIISCTIYHHHPTFVKKVLRSV